MEQKISDGKDHGLKTKRRSISEMGAVVMVAVVAGVEGPDKDGCDAVVATTKFGTGRTKYSEGDYTTLSSVAAEGLTWNNFTQCYS
ncbi:hypothetical protein RRG08_001528 [Elysia crispata]|uniref:Uncharacterized protein n=1 Tax=Elysia crispata TaxID=231223 RepID=A0AAE1A961_9GAST|nr:hypothetical protein RRG08_001528 [Elysia crispata]